MLIFFPPTLLLSPFVIHFGLIPLSSETILILYYFHFTGLMTSPYPHIISRGNFTPSRPSCFLLSPPCLSLSLSSFSLSIHPSTSSPLCLSHQSEVTFQFLPSRWAPVCTTEVGCLSLTHTHTHLPTSSFNLYYNMCLYILCMSCLLYSQGNKMSVHCH